VRKVEKGLGHPVMQDRLQVELALLAAQWLAAAVLRPAGDRKMRLARSARILPPGRAAATV
jgi:hypothetical protein